MNQKEYYEYILPRTGCTPPTGITHSNPNWMNCYIGVPYTDDITIVGGTIPIESGFSPSPYNEIIPTQLSDIKWRVSGTPAGNSTGGTYDIDYAAANCGETIGGSPQLTGTYVINELVPPNMVPTIAVSNKNPTTSEVITGTITILNDSVTDSYGPIQFSHSLGALGVVTYGTIPAGVTTVSSGDLGATFSTENVIAGSGTLVIPFSITIGGSTGSTSTSVNVVAGSGSEANTGDNTDSETITVS